MERSGSVTRTRARWRPPWPAVVSVLVATAVLAAVLIVLSGRATTRMPLDPDDPGPRGTRALASVLADRGVPGEAARSPEDLAAVGVDARTTVVVPNPSELSQSGVDALLRTSPGRLVLVAPGSGIIDALHLPVTVVAQAGPGPFVAECHSELTGDGETVAGSGLLYRSSAPGATTCFPDHSDAADDPTHPPSGLVDLPAAEGRPRLVVLGSTQLLTNVGVTEESHAAIALRTLGGTGRVVWYLPPVDPEDPLVVEGAAAAPRPGWVAPTVLLLSAATIVFCLWRGRRLGPLVTEPLPVVVPAEETTLARARLYRRTGDAHGVGAVLQAAARDDLRTTLRLPPDADSRRLASAVAARLGRTDVEAILDLLTRPLEASELPTASRELHHLRRKVARP